MYRALLFFSFFSAAFCLHGQDKSLQVLYSKTIEVYQDIQQRRHIEALDHADEIIEDYLGFEEGELYLSYLYMYKAEAYLRLGDIMLSELCSRTAMKNADLAGHKDLQFTIEGNLAALDIEKHDYYSCYDRCSSLFSNQHFQPTKDQLGVTLNNMALSAFKIGKYNVADSLFEQLFELSEKEFPGNQFDKSLPYRNYGLYMLSVGNTESAEDNLRIALELYRENLGEDHYETLRAKLYYAEYIMNLGKDDKVETNIEQIISELEPDTLIIRPSEYEYLLIQAYLLKSKYHYISRGLDKVDNIDLSKCLKIIQRASDRIMFVMRYYSAGESGFSLSKIARPVYDFGVKVSLKCFELTNDKQYFKQALKYSDMAKKLSIHSVRLLNQEAIAIPVLESISREFYKHRKRLEFESNCSPTEEQIQDYSRAKNQLDSIYGLVYSRTIWLNRIDNIQKMNKKSVLVSYHDLDSVYVLMGLNSKKLMHFYIDKTDSLSKSIEEFKTILSKKRSGLYLGSEAELFTRLSAKLFLNLLDPVDFINPGDVLLVQTDGELSAIPFEILINPRQSNPGGFDKQSFRDLPYLLRHNPVYYLSSIYRMQGEVGNKSRIIQYDGHAFTDKGEYKESYLENDLSWSSIRSNDYYGCNVYLNGCETGLGPYFLGEGIISLGMSFLYSGANQVIENFWMVSDYSSDILSEHFFLYGGFKRPANALRKAKLKYLEDAPDGMEHPHYWAGTMIQGMSPDRKSRPYWMLSMFLFLLIIPFYRRGRKR